MKVSTVVLIHPTDSRFYQNQMSESLPTTLEAMDKHLNGVLYSATESERQDPKKAAVLLWCRLHYDTTPYRVQTFVKMMKVFYGPQLQVRFFVNEWVD